MGYYPDVKPNDKVKHYAQKENDLNAILSQHSRQGLTPSAGRFKGTNQTGTCIPFQNALDTPIPAFTAVQFARGGDTSTVTLEDFVGGDYIAKGRIAWDVRQPCAILQSDIAGKGDIASAMIVGVTPMLVDVGWWTHNYVEMVYSPSENRLRAKSTDRVTRCCILHITAQKIGNEYICLVALGNTTEVTPYTGAFKVIDISERDGSGNFTYKVRIVDGSRSNPQDEHTAGIVSPNGQVPAADLSCVGIDQFTSYILLKTEYDTTEEKYNYSYYFDRTGNIILNGIYSHPRIDYLPLARITAEGSANYGTKAMLKIEQLFSGSIYNIHQHRWV